MAGVDKYTAVANEYPVLRRFQSVMWMQMRSLIFQMQGQWMNCWIIVLRRNFRQSSVQQDCQKEEQLARVKEVSEKIAVLKSANMSMGINLLLKLLKDAAKVLAPAGYDMELVEKHHNQKLDAPSGTALALADSMNEGTWQ